MAQILPPRTSLGTAIGEAVGQGLGSGIQKGSDIAFNRSRLQQAFDKLEPGANFIEQLKTIAPELLTTPGGAQALSELSPILGKFAQAEAARNAIKNRRGVNQQDIVGNLPEQGSAPVQPIQQNVAPQTAEQRFRNPLAQQSPESIFPKKTAGVQPQKEMSPQQVENYALDIMDQSASTGNPIGYGDALKLAQATNQQVIDNNQRIEGQKGAIQAAQEKLSESIVNRAQNSGLIKTPEDKTVAEKLALQARDAPSEVDAWEYVRTGLRNYEAAKNDLLRSYSVPGPFKSSYRKLLGNYKDKEQAIKDLQPSLEKFRKEGLFDEAKNILVNDIGLGPEDAQRALFPLSKPSEKALIQFPRNKVSSEKQESALGTIGKTVTGALGSLPFNVASSRIENEFPGQSYALPPEKFVKFKDQLGNLLSDHEGINLLALRGQLNQDKRYAWQDVYKAIDELIDERRFTPDVEQDKELKIIRNAPLPGLAQQFKYLWTETK